MTVQKTQQQITILLQVEKEAYDEDGLIWELVQGLVHEFPLCCIMEYCADRWIRNRKPLERGIATFRTFSLAHPNLLEIDRIGSPDIFVPCSKCASRLGPKVMSF